MLRALSFIDACLELKILKKPVRLKQPSVRVWCALKTTLLDIIMRDRCVFILFLLFLLINKRLNRCLPWRQKDAETGVRKLKPQNKIKNFGEFCGLK